MSAGFNQVILIGVISSPVKSRPGLASFKLNVQNRIREEDVDNHIPVQVRGIASADAGNFKEGDFVMVDGRLDQIPIPGAPESFRRTVVRAGYVRKAIKGRMNKAVVMGNVGQSPEIKTTTGGVEFLSFSIASSEWDKEAGGGDGAEVTNWTRVKIFGKGVQNAFKFIKKGSPVLVTGRIDTWYPENADGTRGEITTLSAYDFRFAGKKPSESSGGRAPGADDDDEYSYNEFTQDRAPLYSPPDDELPF